MEDDYFENDVEFEDDLNLMADFNGARYKAPMNQTFSHLTEGDRSFDLD